MNKNRKVIDIILSEVIELHKQQQEGITLLNNKFNWILVSNFVFISALITSNCLNRSVSFFVFVSIVFSFLGMKNRTYKFTASISAMLKKIDEKDFIVAFINKKKKLLQYNSEKILEVRVLLAIAKISLAIAVIIQLHT